MVMLYKAWRLWAKALGSKEGHDREADIVAGIRTLILLAYMVTNVAIVANAVRHWNDNNRNTAQDGRNNSGCLAEFIQTTKRLETTSKITH